MATSDSVSRVVQHFLWTKPLAHCRYIALLRKALDPSDAGKGLYFSHTADLTLTQQRAAELEAAGGKEDSALTARSEQRFFWNKHLLAPFLGTLPSCMLHHRPMLRPTKRMLPIRCIDTVAARGNLLPGCRCKGTLETPPTMTFVTVACPVAAAEASLDLYIRHSQALMALPWRAEPTRMATAEGAPEVDMPALPELAQFVVPLIQGSVHQISDLQLVTSSADYSGSLTLVARRSSQRPGVRHWRRGAAPDVGASPGCM